MMASNSCSSRNTQQVLTKLNQPKNAMVKITPISSTASILSKVLASVLAPTLYT